MNAAAAICSFPNVRLIVWGRRLRRDQSNNPITVNAMKKPAMGEVIFGMSTLFRFLSTLIALQSPPADATAAPQRPPINAWLELDGSPSHHVNKFQIMPPMSPHRMVVSVTK